MYISFISDTENVQQSDAGRTNISQKPFEKYTNYDNRNKNHPCKTHVNDTAWLMRNATFVYTIPPSTVIFNHF